MLTTPRVRPDLSAACRVSPLIARTVLRVPDAELPITPPSWHVRPSAQIATPTRRQRGFITPCGTRAIIGSTMGVPASAAPRIALVNLGGHRIAVSGADESYEASWTCGRRSHRLAVEPVTLLDFMTLLFGLRWPE